MSTSEHPSPIESAEDRLILWQRATPRGEQSESTLAFCRKVRTRMEVAGGELLATSGGAVGASFDAMELPDVIELALGIATDAADEVDSLEVACGIAYGPVQLGPAVRTVQGAVVPRAAHGAAVDRAQLLAHRAESGETLLDEAAAQQAEPAYLFLRELRAGSSVGRVIDPVFDKRGCRNAVHQLLDTTWPVREPASYTALKQRLGSDRPRILLSSATTHGALDHVARARAELMPTFVLHAARDGAGLAPLGSLAVALRRVWNVIRAIELPAPAREVIERIHSGAGVGRTEACAALGVLLRAVTTSVATPWLVLERARELDAPSLLVLGDLFADAGTRCVLIATAEEGVQAPAALVRMTALETIGVDPLDEADRTRAAASMLSLLSADALVQRVAELGGDSVLAIREAARALVSNGDVVHDGTRFRFRTADRHGAGAVAIEELVLARASGLPNVAHRVLEAVCIAPIASERAFTHEIAVLDGLPPEAVLAGFDQLTTEGFVSDSGGLGPLETTVRFAVRAAMPPARAAELHRFVARALRNQHGMNASSTREASAREASTPAREPRFIDADIAHHLAEGGNETAAARSLLEGASAARANGFDRVAVRLAALALKLDSSTDMRKRAAQLAQSVGTRAETDPLHDTAPSEESDKPSPHPAAPAVKEALRAILACDADAAEGALDTAVTMGLGRAAAGRLSAIAQLAKGDIPEAVRVLKRSRASGNGSAGASSIKQALTAALILIEAGQALDAMRSALEALALSRRAGEDRGEHASLFVLSGCYRLLGRFADADRIDVRALA